MTPERRRVRLHTYWCVALPYRDGTIMYRVKPGTRVVFRSRVPAESRARVNGGRLCRLVPEWLAETEAWQPMLTEPLVCLAHLGSGRIWENPRGELQLWEHWGKAVAARRREGLSRDSIVPVQLVAVDELANFSPVEWGEWDALGRHSPILDCARG